MIPEHFNMLIMYIGLLLIPRFIVLLCCGNIKQQYSNSRPQHALQVSKGTTSDHV